MTQETIQQATNRVRKINLSENENNIVFSGSEKECEKYLLEKFDELQEEFKENDDYYLDEDKEEIKTELGGYGGRGEFNYEIEEYTFEIDLKTKLKLDKLLKYIIDEEDGHFFENCVCSDEIKESEDNHFKLCKCKDNKNHIFRFAKDVENKLL